MPLVQKEKATIIKKHQRHQKDTGSAEVQIAMLTQRINDLTEHLKSNSKDFSTRRGLMKLVGQRRRLQNYYKTQATPEDYKKLLTQLKLRK